MARQAFTNDQYEKSLPELVTDLTHEVSQLVRQEVALAKIELAEKGKRAGIGAGFIGGAGLLAFLALGALTTCLIIALGAIMPTALAALIIAVLYGGVAAVMGMNGKTRLKTAVPPTPEETVESVKEDVRWLKGQKP
jgi:uncharacterized membrane protein YqjE